MADLLRVELPHRHAPGGHVNGYLLGEERALLVDPGHRTDDLDSAVAERDVSHVAVTHHHPDHAGAVAHYADETGATVWCRQGRERAFDRATGVAPDRTFREGTVVDTGAGPVSVVETPGHAPEHVAFTYDDGEDGSGDTAWLGGDLAFAAGSVAVVAPEGDLRAYLASLRRLHARAPARLHPGHGPVVEDPRAAAARLVAHRDERERKVRAAVEDGAATVPDVTDRAYDDKDVSAVRSMAEGTVRAHLEKLAAEGHLDWDGERATRA